MSLTCPICFKSFSRTDNLSRHLRAHGQNNDLKCRLCSYQTPRKGNLKRHYLLYHGDRELPSSSTSEATAEGDLPQVPAPELTFESEDDKLIKANWKWIRTNKVVGRRIQDRYNYQLSDPTTSDLIAKLKQIFGEQRHPFKLNLSFGFILRNIITDERVFYYASGNNRLFPSPLLVSELQDIDKVREHIDRDDLLEYCRLHRPNTKFVVEKITNVLFYINKLKQFRIGCGCALPGYIKVRKCIFALEKDRYGVQYTDNLCIFRCLACHKGVLLDSPEFATTVFSLSASYLGGTPLAYQGITITELPHFERYFNLKLEVHNLDWDEEAAMYVASRVYRSLNNKSEDTMHVNYYNGHFSYINDIHRYSDQWVCDKCGKFFNRYFSRNRHERLCAEKTKIAYKGGGYGSARSIFDSLRSYGVPVPNELRFFPFLATFDLECISVPLQEDDPAQKSKINFTRELIPASFAVCSNVPGFKEPKCFISDGNPAALVASLYNYLSQISDRCYDLLLPLYESLFASIDERISELESTTPGTRSSSPSSSPHSVPSPLSDESADGSRKHPMARNLEALGDQLDLWLHRMPVFGYNSGRFDINLIRRYIFPYLLSENIAVDHVIKRINDYITFSTDKLLFLDMKNFTAQSVSYAKFLKSSDVEGSKFFWPHDWFDSLEKLDTPYLVDKSCFWSVLHQEGISDEDYESVRRVWEVERFQTMRDLFLKYSYADVEPFVRAAEKMHKYWQDLGVEAFKSSSISLPGLALSLLMMRMQVHTILPVFGEDDADLFQLIQGGTCGGLSIVMSRFAETGKTRLPDGSLCAKIISTDANGLYLYALSQRMGTALYFRWHPSNDTGVSSLTWKLEQGREMRMRWHDIEQYNLSLHFTRVNSFKYSSSELEWLEWTASRQRRRIEHRFNGRQLRVPFSKKCTYAVDGFDPVTQTIYQFHGCYWHGHGCHLDSNRNREDAALRAATTHEVTQNLTALGYTVVEMWECQWIEQKRLNPVIHAFLRYHLTLSGPKRLTGFDIIQRVLNGQLFGLIEVDCEIPWWDAENVEKFQHFPPIWKNTNIGLADIGEHMREYAIATGYLPKPRRCLINSYWGRKILITTDLLRWYLNHGLRVTRIYQMLEMKPKCCFAGVAAEVTEHRRHADRDERYKSNGETWKTVGNCFFGKPSTNKNRHKDTKLLSETEAPRYVNDRRFHHMEEIGETAYEVTMDKKRIIQDLPITVSYWVYNSARLRMLEFIYDFLQRYMRPGSYQLISSDTDNIVAAYSSANLDDLVRDELKPEYDAVKSSFLVTREEDKRTLGLFKYEWDADTVISLCAKTQILSRRSDGDAKVSSKGLSKRTNKFTDKDFLEVLETKCRGRGQNYGFKLFRDKLYQYSQSRAGLSYLYIKREVMSDGISTRPLQL